MLIFRVIGTICNPNNSEGDSFSKHSLKRLLPVVWLVLAILFAGVEKCQNCFGLHFSNC